MAALSAAPPTRKHLRVREHSPPMSSSCTMASHRLLPTSARCDRDGGRALAPPAAALGTSAVFFFVGVLVGLGLRSSLRPAAAAAAPSAWAGRRAKKRQPDMHSVLNGSRSTMAGPPMCLVFACGQASWWQLAAPPHHHRAARSPRPRPLACRQSRRPLAWHRCFSTARDAGASPADPPVRSAGRIVSGGGAGGWLPGSGRRGICHGSCCWFGNEGGRGRTGKGQHWGMTSSLSGSCFATCRAGRAAAAAAAVVISPHRCTGPASTSHRCGFRSGRPQ